MIYWINDDNTSKSVQQEESALEFLNNPCRPADNTSWLHNQPPTEQSDPAAPWNLNYRLLSQ